MAKTPTPRHGEVQTRAEELRVKAEDAPAVNSATGEEVTDEDQGIVDRRPPNIVTLEEAINTEHAGRKLAATGATAPNTTAFAPVFDDEHAGSGGTFAYNAKGDRVQVHEKIEEDGEVKYRPLR